MRIALVFLAVVFVSTGSAAQCTARSGDRTAALVELYTSQGCTTCRPADRWLSALGERYAMDQVVALSLHVDYRDYIGSKDRHGKREIPARQRKLTQLQKNALVYTPQVMLQGKDFRGWGSGAFDAAVERVNAAAAGVRITLEILESGPQGPRQAFEVRATAQRSGPDQAGEAALYLAAYEDKLPGQVHDGEQRGRLLAHDYVVLEWQGPFGLNGSAPFVALRSLPLLPNAVPAHSGVAAFVQNRRTGEVLQALMLPACRG